MKKLLKKLKDTFKTVGAMDLMTESPILPTMPNRLNNFPPFLFFFFISIAIIQS